MINLYKSKKIFNKSKMFIPGGVNSPVRAYSGVNSVPPIIKSAKGSKLYDIDNNEYIDFVGSWGPMILGHSDKDVIEATKRAIDNGTSFGAPTELELEMAETITEMIPSIDMVRLVNSGTEAAMSAVRLARGYTNKKRIIKFEGCYHGHYDGFLAKAGSGALTLSIPGSPGVPEEIVGLTHNAEFNNIESVQKIVENNKNEIATVILEPIPGNMGCIAPDIDFLKKLKTLCKNENIVLIFDEVMSGFRVSSGGAQKLYGIEPDITVLGKIIGGGMPIGAFGGKKEIMNFLAPAGNVYQAGTLSGNPVAVTCGLTTLKKLSDNEIYIKLEQKGNYMEQKIKKLIKQNNYPLYFNRIGAMFTLFFSKKEVKNYNDATNCDIKKFNQYFKMMLENKIYIAPSQFEAGFISITHSEQDLDKNFEIQTKVLAKIFG